VETAADLSSSSRHGRQVVALAVFVVVAGLSALRGDLRVRGRGEGEGDTRRAEGVDDRARSPVMAVLFLVFGVVRSRRGSAC
jgi:hypothetical protein